MIDVIILAGGLGTRLHTILPHLPKALAPIQGIPFLQIVLQKLKCFSPISKIVMALGHKADAISSFLQNYPSIGVAIEPNPLGTGGAILHALDKTTEETLLILNGDTFFDIDLDAFYAFHKKNDSLATLAARYEEHTGRYGSLQLRSDQSIAHFEEKSSRLEGGWVSGGLYLLQKELFSSFAKGKSYSLEYDFLPYFLEKKAFAYCEKATFIDIGTAESYQEAQIVLQPWIHQ